MSPLPRPEVDPNPEDSDHRRLIAENTRLVALLAEQDQIRGARLIRLLAAAGRSGPVRWIRRLVSARAPDAGAPFAWSWAQTAGADETGLCTLADDDPFFGKLLAQRPDAVTVVHPNWRGVRSSAENLFDCRLYIDTLSESEAVRLAQGLAEAHVTRVVFQGMPLTHGRLVRALARYSPKTRLFVIWHGNFMQLGESADWHGLQTVLDWARQGVVERVGFVKQGMAEVFARQGIPTGYLLNYVRRIPDGPSTPMEDGPHLGLWAVEPIWRKLPYTMIAAAALVPGATLWAAGQNRRAEEVAALVGVPYRRLADGPLPQSEMPAALARMHVNLYVTLSECAPMLPLESLAAGVPCLVGPSSTFFDDAPALRTHLVVSCPDDTTQLAGHVQSTLEYRIDIIRTYTGLASRWARESRSLRHSFLGVV